MKKILYVLLIALVMITTGCSKRESDGTNVAKILLAKERLNPSVLEDSGRIFNGGAKAFNNILRKTRESNRRYADKKSGTYVEVEGDTYKWYNNEDYSNFLEYFESYAKDIEHNASQGAELIDNTKKYVRVTDVWIKADGEEYFLIVEEDYEIIICRDDFQTELCKRTTNESGQSVYEMLIMNENAHTRMKYIPDLLYEFTISMGGENAHYLIADKYKGYWQIVSTNGFNGYYDGNEKVESLSLTLLAMKEEATYMLGYNIDNRGKANVGGVNVLSKDGESDMISMSLRDITFYNTGINGLDHIEITAPKDRVGDFDPNSEKELDVYIQDNVNEKGEEYKIYSTSGRKSATAVCSNGVTVTDGDRLLDGKVKVGHINVSYVAGCDAYGQIPFYTMSESYEEQFEILEDILEYTGFTFRRDYDSVIACIKYALQDAEIFAKYFTINGYHIDNYNDMKKAFEIEDNKEKELSKIYEEVKDYEVIRKGNQEKIDSRIKFTDLEVLNNGEVKNDGLNISVKDYKVKVEDTLLYVDGEEYMIVFGLLSKENNVVSYIDEFDLKFTYTKGVDFELSQTKEFTIPLLETGEYILVSYVALASENIRISKYTEVKVDVKEESISLNGYNNEIKNSNGSLLIESKSDLDVKLESEENYSYNELIEFMSQKAYEHGMIEEKIIEKYDGSEWTVVQSNEEIINGEYRMKYYTSSASHYIYLKLK